MAYGVQASGIRFRKVMKILSKFDANRDGHLSREELAALVVAVNPKADFDEEQIAAILDEVFRTYDDYIEGDQGLSFDGLLQTYYDGAGDIDRDFNALGLELDKENGVLIRDEPNGSRSGNGNAADVSGVDDLSSKKKEDIGAWALSPTIGIASEKAWDLVLNLGAEIRKLEAKLGETMFCNDPSPVSFGWARNADSADGPSARQVIIGQRQWEELGPDYLHFQTAVADMRQKADQANTQEEAFCCHMSSGRILFDHRFYKEALMSFDRAEQLRPADARVYFYKGNTLFALGRMPGARDAYTEALGAGDADGKFWSNLLPQIHVNLGITLESEGLLLGASEHYKEAAIKEPKHYRALKLLGSALYGVGECKAAKEALLEAVSLRPDYPDAHCELGSVLHALGDHDEAIAEFEKVLELESKHVEALYNLATLLKDIQEYRRSATAYTKVLALQPSHWRAQLNQAVSLLGAGAIDDARRAFKEAYKMTRRSELYDALVHLQQMENKPQGFSSFFRRGEASFGEAGNGFRASNNYVEVPSARFRIVDSRTTSRQLLAFGIEARQLQKHCRLNRCDVSILKKELNQGGSSLSSGVGVSEKLIRKEALEKRLRHLLQFLKPEAFQGAMKLINERILMPLDPTASGRVDLGMVFAVLAIICGGSLDKRKRVAFDALLFRSRRITNGEISRQDAKDYLKTLKASYLRAQEEKVADDVSRNIDRTGLSFPEFAEILDDSKGGFGIMNVLAKLEMKENTLNSRKLCSVCSYPITGPGFKETKIKFNLCSMCYSSGKVPSSAHHEDYFYFKEFNTDLGAKLHSFKKPFTSC